MRDYGKVHTSFWTSKTVRDMTEDGRTLAIYLLSCPHGTIAGVARIPDGYACEDLKWPAERVRASFAELKRHDFAERCEETGWVWIKQHFDWNPLDNPNQRKAARKVADQVPSACAWLQAFHLQCGQFFRLDTDPVRNPSETVTGTLSEPFRNQEQEQEQEQKTPATSAPEPGIDQPKPDDSPAAPSADANDVRRCPVGTLVDLYHELMPLNPRVKVLSEPRKKAIRARWKEAAQLAAKPFGYSTRAQGLQAWRQFFEVCAESAFLTGRAKAEPGKPPFLADIDFIFSPSGFAKTLENKYHREAA
jgi:hypothetical protein